MQNNRLVLFGIVLVLVSFMVIPRNVYSDHDDDFFDARNFYNLQDQIRDFYDDGDYDIDWDDRYYYRDYDCDDDDCDWDDCDDDDHDDDDCDYHDDDDYDYHDDDRYEHKEKYEYDKDIDIKDNYNREKKLTFEIENYYDYSGKMKDSELIIKDK